MSSDERETKRSHIGRSRLIPAAPEAVWALLARLDQISRWAKTVDHSTYTTTATEGVGAARRVQAGPLALIETVTEWEPVRRLTYAIEGLPPIVGGVTNSWSLEPAPGGTRATLTTTVDHRVSIGGRVAAFALSRVFAKASERMLAGLAQHLGDSPTAKTS